MSRCLFVSLLAIVVPCAGAEIWPEGLERVRQPADTPWVLSRAGHPEADVVLLADSELLRSAARWLADFVQRTGRATLPLGGGEQLQHRRRHLVAAVGQEHPLVKRLADAGRLRLEPRVGPQGFVLQRVTDPEAGDLLVCWSPAELGCRYGLIEILRSLEGKGSTVITSLGRVVERPQFPVRICYVNFAEHLQNAYNPNLLFDTPVNRWSQSEWEQFIDMLSAFRYNLFEFWLVPTLFSPEALQGGKIHRRFAETMNRVIAYGKRRGVGVHPIQAVNTVGQQWHCHCPKDPKEHAEIVALWDYWARTLHGLESMGFFPGDPGGCCRNGCTAETYVDLCLDLCKVVRKDRPDLKIEVGTWGEPFGGWGVPLWTGKPDRAERSMKYFLAKLPEFPPETFTSINLGFSPDCHPTHGGDGKPFARQAARTHPVLTWDYSVTEGESTVSPRCRVRRIFQRRREELVVGCYSGGICYTMAPKLNCASIFACAEAYWNPALEPGAALADYGRLVFDSELAAIGPLLEEFEVIRDWGYYPAFPYSPQRLQASMVKLRSLLERIAPDAGPRLPLAPTMAAHRRDLLYFAGLFQNLAQVAMTLDEAATTARAAGTIPRTQETISLDEMDELLAAPADFPQKPRIRELAATLRQLDVRAMTKHYWAKVYGIYDVIPHPVDPRAQGATAGLFSQFQCPLAIAHEPSPLRMALQATGKPFLLVTLGHPGGERGWTLRGWSPHGEYEGETWRASFTQPGVLTRPDFVDRGYRWLVVRLTEGPKGERKTIAINGKKIGQFVRTGPPVQQRKEWWVTRSFAIPEGLLRNGPIEIRFSEPGVAVAAVALAAERISESQ